MQTLTSIEQAAIHLGVPQSGNAQVDQMIRESNINRLRDSIAARLAAEYADDMLNKKASVVAGIAEAATYLAETICA